MSNVDNYWNDIIISSPAVDMDFVFASIEGLQQPENAPFEVQSGSNEPTIRIGDNQDMDSHFASIEGLQLPENAPFEVQSGSNEPTIWIGNNQDNSSSRKRHMDVVSPNLSDARKRPSRQSRRRSTITGESSIFGEPAKTTEEALTYAERIKALTVGESAKLLIDRINHRMKSAREIQLNLLRTHDHIKTQWSLAAELQKVMKDTGATEAEIQKFMDDMVATEAEIQKFRKEMNATEAEIQRIKHVITKIPKDGKLTEAAAKQRLIEMENEELNKFLQDMQNARKMYKQICQETEKIDEKTRELQPFFLNMLSIEGNTATDVGVTVKEDKYSEDLQSKFRDLENQLYSVDNNKVENHDFPGLEQALDHTTGRKIPDHLKLIEFRIEMDRGKAAGSAHFGVLVLVCAAIKEMEDSEEFSDWEILKKWAATLNQAKELGFQVGFADRLLKAKLYAYFATQLLKSEAEGGC